MTQPQHERTYVFNLPEELISKEDIPVDTFLSKEAILELRKTKSMTISEARTLKHPAITAQIERIVSNSRNKRMVKDGFESGWQENIQEYVGGRREYDQRLKELGLVELGYDAKPVDTSYVSDPTTTYEFAMEALKLGAIKGEQEVDALMSGELLKDVEIDV